MYLKLIDEQGTTKFVNISNAQSIEKFIDLDETNNLFKTGIRIIWHDQVIKDSENEEDDLANQPYYYSEQLFFGISFEALESLMIQNKELVPPAMAKDKADPTMKKVVPTEDKENGKAKDPVAEVENKLEKVSISTLDKDTIDIVEPAIAAVIPETPVVETKVVETPVVETPAVKTKSTATPKKLRKRKNIVKSKTYKKSTNKK